MLTTFILSMQQQSEKLTLSNRYLFTYIVDETRSRWRSRKADELMKQLAGNS